MEYCRESMLTCQNPALWNQEMNKTTLPLWALSMECAKSSATLSLNVVQVTCSVEKTCQDIQGGLRKNSES